MADVSTYLVFERLRDGSMIRIRALRPDDREGMHAAIDRTSAQSLRRRFFIPKRSFSDRDIAYFIDVDFNSHVALVAELEENGARVIVGGGRYAVTEAGNAELAFVVVDAYQGRGIATALLRHLVSIARGAGLNALTAEILHENVPMLKVFERLGFERRPVTDATVIHMEFILG